MIDKAVAKLTGFGPQGARTENRGQTGEGVDATALGRLFQKHLSTLGGKAEATGAAFLVQSHTGYGQAEPPSRNDYDDYRDDRPEPTSYHTTAPSERRDRPQDSTTDAPRERARSDEPARSDERARSDDPARSDDDGGRSETAAPQEKRTDTSAHDDGPERGGGDGKGAEPATAQDAGDTSGGSQVGSSGSDDEGTGPASSGETTNAASGMPAVNGATAQTAAGTTATTATAQVIGSAGATQGAGNVAPAGKAQQPQGQASDPGKPATTVATQGEAPKTGGSNAGNHGLGGDQANARQQQMPGNADKPAEAPKQAADPQARARQGQEISQAIGRAGEGSKVEVKVSTDMRGAGRGPTVAGPQDGVAASGSNAQSGGQTGGQTGGSNQQTAQAQLAQQQAAQQQAPGQVSQQVQPQNQQAGQSQVRGGAVATSPAAAVSAAGNGASHALQGGGEGSLQTAGAAGGSQSQSSQQTQSSAHAQAAQPQRAAQGGQPVADQVSVKITKAVQAGQDRIHIQLKPAELGRVDVRIEMTHDGRAVTIVTADKADTLDLLRRDSEQLQKALADAGLDTDSGDLSFNLRGEGQEGEETKDTGAGRQLADGDDAAGEEAAGSNDDGVMLALDSGILMPGHVDLRA